MKPKLFSIFCCLLLSASMVTQAQLLDAVNDSPEGGIIPTKANRVSGRNNAPQTDWYGWWSYADQGNSVMNTNGYGYLGALGNVKVYRYQWDSDLQIYFAFTDNGATWTSPISGATVVVPARGSYTVTDDNPSDHVIGGKNTAWDGNGTRSRYIESGTSYYFNSATWYVAEGVDGPYIYTTNLTIRYIYSGYFYNPGGSYAFKIGEPAVYKSVTVQSENASKGTVSYAMKSGYVYTTNITDWKEGSTYTINASANPGYQFDHWSDNGAQSHDITITGDATYTAYFAPAQYSITYKDQGNATFTGAHESGYPTTHTYGTATTLKTAAKADYTFDGWFTNSACTGSPVTSLGATAYTSNITLYAKWTYAPAGSTYTLLLDKTGNGTVTVRDADNGNALVAFTNNEAQVTENHYVSITATPAAGYHLTTLTFADEDVDQEDTYGVEGDNLTIVAVFSPDVYTITYKDKGNGEFTGTHGANHPTTHTYGTATNLVNPTKSGAVFGGWYENSSCTGSSVTSIAATAKTADFTLYAKWRGTITATASGSGSVSGAGTYDVGSNASLTATPSNSNYYLYDWEKDGVSLGVRTNPLVQSVTANAAYTAIFREKEWTLTVNSDNPSLGTASGSGKYYNGENTTLVATPANSFTSFVKWQKNGVDIAGGASLNVTVNANDTYTAFFSGRNIIEVDIDASYTDRWSIYSLRGYSSDNKYYVDAAFNTSNHALSSVDGITYNGSSMSFTNKAVDGIDQPCGNRRITHLYCYNSTGDVYRFNIHWHSPWDDDKNDTYPNDRIITNNIQIGYEAALGAVYVYGYNTWEDFTSMSSRAFGLYFVTGQRCSDDIKLPVGTYPINCSGEPGTVMSYQPGVGEIDLYGGWAKTQGIVFGYYLLDTGMVTVSKSGTTYTITVNAKNSYGNVLNSTITFSESDLSSTTIPNYTLNVNTDGHGTASVKRYDCNGDLNAVSNSGSYKQGSYFQLEATPSVGYIFDYWTITGSEEHFEENPVELEGLYDNATVTAHFRTAAYYNVSISAPENGTVTVSYNDGSAQSFTSGSRSIAEGTVLTVTTTPAADYHFADWTNDGAASVTVDGAKTIGATFAQNDYFLNATYGTHGTGVTRDDSGNSETVKRAGNTVTLTPVAESGYEFLAWTGDDAANMSGNVFTFPTNGTHNTTYNVQATFQTITYDLTYNGLEGATHSNPATYTVETATITLTDPSARTGYTFTGWTCGGNPITQITLGSTGDKTITANWTQNGYTVTLVKNNDAYGTLTDSKDNVIAEITGVEDNAGISISGNRLIIGSTTVTATAADKSADGIIDYEFVNWTDGDGKDLPTMVTADMTIRANFTRFTTLCENCDNGHYTAFMEYDKQTLTAKLFRKFESGRWSTLCLPFNVNKALFSNLNFGSRIYEFKYATGNADDGVNLYFSIAKSIQAGKGYIVNADAKLAARTSFTFSGVTMDLSADNGAELNSVKAYDNLTNGCSTEGSNIELVGTLRKGILKGSDGNNRYMGLKENKIYYPNIATGSTILAYRGIFRSIEGTLNAERIRIIVDGEEKAELEVINGELQDVQETKKFIENGVLYIERNGVIYDATGRKVE